MSELPVIELLSTEAAEVDASVIWLHGLGADGNDFVPVVPQLNLPADYAVRFVFPTAPSVPVTINNGYVMPAWYDILRLDNVRSIDEAGLRESAAKVQALIRRELDRGIESERIVLAGFSQGGAVCFEAGLSFGQRLGGIIALSTYFPTADSVAMEPVQQGIPILVCHGLMDPMVPEFLGRAAVESLGEKGLTPEYDTYPMAHEVCMPEIERVGGWIRTVLSH
ncbi:MAG: carboxylesterase [Gammaproteobacteria bacterium]|nr:carboxylesterase [Gammaproteobacteria bacterium]MYH86298.1 carboxylesterase [Gammaproteobacteria bacterium]MYK04288.1 carboxylesterase [Gammaproteobacteria bacterium]